MESFKLVDISDGVMFMTDENGTEVLSKPENGLYKNETFFLSGADAAEHLRIQTGKPDLHCLKVL